MKSNAPFMVIICTMVLFSCKTQSNEKLIIGNWTADNIIVTFDKKGIITSKLEGRDSSESRPFQLIKNGEYIVTQNKNSISPDTVKIVELTDKLLKIATPQKDTIEFNRAH